MNVFDVSTALAIVFVIHGFVGSYASSPQFNHFKILSSRKVKEDFVSSKGKSTSLLKCTALCGSEAKCGVASFKSDGMECHVTSYTLNGHRDQNGFLTDSSWRAIARYPFDCIDGWTKMGDTCYHLAYTWKTFTDAENYCKGIGGILAEPRTNAMFQLLRTYLLDHGKAAFYWFGLRDMRGDDSFVWRSNGDAPLYTAWAYNKPLNQEHGANCAVLSRRRGYKWEDAVCTYAAAIICQV